MTAKKILETQGLRLSIPDTWVVEESSTEITLRPSVRGGAITISTYRHQETNFRPDAVDQCARFIAIRTNQDVEVRGTSVSASADFCDDQRVWWLVRIITRLNRFALATYNTEIQRDGEMEEARAILGGIVFDG